MEKPRKSYNLLAGIIVLLAVVVTVAMTGYIVSRPEPPVIPDRGCKGKDIPAGGPAQEEAGGGIRETGHGPE